METSNIVTIVGLSVVIIYAIIQICNFYGISIASYGVYLAFYALFIVFYLTLPRKLPEI